MKEETSMKLHRSLLVLAVGTFAVGASAQEPNLKPGLWQITHKMTTASGQIEKASAELQKQMADMPPEQRKMMEDMMAQRGMSMGAGGPLDMSAKVCMTRDMVERNEIPVQQGNCKTTMQSRTASSTKMSFSCTDPPSSGEGQYTMVSPEAYTAKMTVRTAVQGKPETMNMDTSGKWLGADCGSVKAIPQRTP
jgi:hypothetical protein